MLLYLCSWRKGDAAKILSAQRVCMEMVSPWGNCGKPGKGDLCPFGSGGNLR